MIGYLHLDDIALEVWKAAAGRLKRTACFFSPPRLGHKWGSGAGSWWGGMGCRCGKKQSVGLSPGE